MTTELRGVLHFDFCAYRYVIRCLMSNAFQNESMYKMVIITFDLAMQMHNFNNTLSDCLSHIDHKAPPAAKTPPAASAAPQLKRSRSSQPSTSAQAASTTASAAGDGAKPKVKKETSQNGRSTKSRASKSSGNEGTFYYFLVILLLLLFDFVLFCFGFGFFPENYDCIKFSLVLNSASGSSTWFCLCQSGTKALGAHTAKLAVGVK